MSAREGMHASRLSLHPVQPEDFEDMLALRIAALRASLERLGRFNPQVARERLQRGFVPPHMQHIVLDGRDRVGFITLKPEPGEDALRLDHLYLRPGAQGQGIGAWALGWAMGEARRAGLPIKLTALQRSDANRFYQRHGFVQEGEDALDVHYRWRPDTVAAQAAAKGTA